MSQTLHLQQIYRWHYMRFDRSRSFKVIDFCTYRKPTHDFLLVINCNRSCSASPFPTCSAEKSKTHYSTSVWAPSIKQMQIPLKCRHQTQHSKSSGNVLLSAKSALSLFSLSLWQCTWPHCWVSSCTVLSQHTRWLASDRHTRQTTYSDNSRTAKN